MLLLYRLKWLDRLHFALFALLFLRLGYYVLARWFSIDLPWIIFRLAILQYLSWFALGISIYLATNRRGPYGWRVPALTSAMAIATLWVCESTFVAVLAVGLATAVFLAARGSLPILQLRPLVWLGKVSYPLYLLHENIGWAIQLRLRSIGVPVELTVLIALAASLLLAGALTRWVEQPAMRWIRTRYRNRARLTPSFPG